MLTGSAGTVPARLPDPARLRRVGLAAPGCAFPSALRQFVIHPTLHTEKSLIVLVVGISVLFRTNVAVVLQARIYLFIADLS